MKVLGLRQTNRLGFLLKIFIFVALLLIIFNIYLSSYNSEMFAKIYSRNMTIGHLQDKVAEFVQRGQIFGLERELTEQEKAKLLGLDDGITEETRRIMKKLNITEAGEWGAPVIYNVNHSAEIQQLEKKLRETYGYNALASSMVSLNRALPDKRSEYCKKKNYPKNLPQASVVIPFHDDDWMLLMRALHSVLLRTPDHLLREVLLVFDLSDREYYFDKLDAYVEQYPKVRIVRSHRRQGIISNRILGARNAKGPIIVYIDSHVEVTPGWIEPLLARINEQPNVIAWAKTSSIDTENMRIWLDDSPGALGTFKWSMAFDWMNIQWYEGDHPTPKYEPKPSLTFIGPCYALRKDFYHKIGLLDPEFDIWGGEDVELGLRAWMCGGRVELIPCSVAAHMFKSHTYTMHTKGKGGARYNTDRIAEVWLDEYKRYYYRLVGDTKNRNFGDISERLELKKKLGCKPFKWFLENMHPKMPIPKEISDEVWEKKEKENKMAEEERKRKEQEELFRKEQEKRKQLELKAKP